MSFTLIFMIKIVNHLLLVRIEDLSETQDISKIQLFRMHLKRF